MNQRAPSSWISMFLEAQAAELGAATNTLLAYGRDLKDFDAWLARRDMGFETVVRDDVESYLVYCDDQGLAKSTRARRLSAVKQLYRFAFEEGLRSDNPAIQIAGPGQDKRLPKVLSVEEVDRLLDVARHSGRSAADRVRNTCLMELLYATGMRVSELVSLPISATRGDPRLLLIMGKGGKERMVPLSPPARIATSDYLEQRDLDEEAARKAGKPASKYLFPSFGKDDQIHCAGLILDGHKRHALGRFGSLAEEYQPRHADVLAAAEVWQIDRSPATNFIQLFSRKLNRMRGQ